MKKLVTVAVALATLAVPAKALTRLNPSIHETPPHETTLTGTASFYGNESGSKTASGKRFNENAMTCAHRSLPFGTKLRVTYQGRSVVVTVTDRGPYIKGRFLDLSKGAAKVIGLIGAGVGTVIAEVVS